jgi:hypothetical protein
MYWMKSEANNTGTSQSILTLWAQVVLAFVSGFAGPISPISVQRKNFEQLDEDCGK